MLTALVTGTSSGIGRATALHLAGRGYRVFAGARRVEAVESHENIVPVRLDVDQDESVQECVAEVLGQAGAIDVLVNNAGFGLAGAVEMMPLHDVRRLFETNFYGAVRMMQAVLPGMRERRQGTIVNISSVMGHVTLGAHGFYSATKFALAAVSEALAIEARVHGVRVAIVEPGVILTPVWDKATAPELAGHLYEQALGRLWRLFGAQVAGGTRAEAVAQVIEDAVLDGGAKLRYQVGADCEVMAAARDRMTAGEWAELLSEPDEERFVARAEEAFGADLYNAPSLNQRRHAGRG